MSNRVSQIIASYRKADANLKFEERIQSEAQVVDYMEKIVIPKLPEWEIKEHFVVIALSVKKHPVGWHLVSMGGSTATIVEPKGVYSVLVATGADSYVAVHNHPSGVPEPSRADIRLTSRLVQGGKILGIEMVDHVIMGDNVSKSLKYEGYM